MSFNLEKQSGAIAAAALFRFNRSSAATSA
jgi:hypothetical protein